MHPPYFRPGHEAPAEGPRLTVDVPAAHVAVLDGLQRLAETATRQTST